MSNLMDVCTDCPLYGGELLKSKDASSATCPIQAIHMVFEAVQHELPTMQYGATPERLEDFGSAVKAVFDTRRNKLPTNAEPFTAHPSDIAIAVSVLRATDFVLGRELNFGVVECASKVAADTDKTLTIGDISTVPVSEITRLVLEALGLGLADYSYRVVPQK